MGAYPLNARRNAVIGEKCESEVDTGPRHRVAVAYSAAFTEREVQSRAEKGATLSGAV